MKKIPLVTELNIIGTVEVSEYFQVPIAEIETLLETNMDEFIKNEEIMFMEDHLFLRLYDPTILEMHDNVTVCRDFYGNRAALPCLDCTFLTSKGVIRLIMLLQHSRVANEIRGELYRAMFDSRTDWPLLDLLKANAQGI